MTGARILSCLRRVSLALPALLLQTNQLWAQRLGQGNGDDIAPWRILGALALCIAVAVFAAFALKARLRGGKFPGLKPGTRRLQVIETMRLGSQNDVCIIVCDGEEFLLSSSAHGVSLIRSLGPRQGEP